MSSTSLDQCYMCGMFAKQTFPFKPFSQTDITGGELISPQFNCHISRYPVHNMYTIQYLHY